MLYLAGCEQAASLKDNLLKPQVALHEHSCLQIKQEQEAEATSKEVP